jgi:glycosyltransferase involved in cell wall biosynthesis
LRRRANHRFCWQAEYARASIFCAPAVWDDPCPLTISEGIASGCAVFTTHSGSIAEVGGKSVLYFKRNNAQSLPDVLASLIDAAEFRVECGLKARERALLISWENQYDKW